MTKGQKGKTKDVSFSFVIEHLAIIFFSGGIGGWLMWMTDDGLKSFLYWE
jgi:hypothetical protein